MSSQELLEDLTQSYLKSVISEASGTLSADFDARAPFGELGINSFSVLKIIKKLEVDFGRLPKSLLFENFNVNDLANYFVNKHERVLAAKFSRQLEGGNGYSSGNGHYRKPVEVVEAANAATVNEAR